MGHRTRLRAVRVLAGALEILNTAEQVRREPNAMGWAIEPAPDGLLVGGACKNVAPLTRQGAAYLDFHCEREAIPSSPPFDVQVLPC